MVFEKVRESFMDIMGFEQDEVLMESLIYDELDADSLDISQIILAIENEYDIEIDNNFVADMQSVKELVEHIESLKE